MGSSRLPLKSMLNLRGEPVINWVVKRIKKSARLTGMIVAIPDTPLDHILASHLEQSGIAWVKGPEDDVLKRFCIASETTNADYIVRVCADNPLIWWKAIDDLIDFYANSELDYAYNHIPLHNSWPDGLGAELISADLLRKLDNAAKAPSQREHCLNYIHDNPQEFKIGTFSPEQDWLARPDLKLDLDTAEDYRRLASAEITPESDAREIISAFSEKPAKNGGLRNPQV